MSNTLFCESIGRDCLAIYRTIETIDSFLLIILYYFIIIFMFNFFIKIIFNGRDYYVIVIILVSATVKYNFLKEPRPSRY